MSTPRDLARQISQGKISRRVSAIKEPTLTWAEVAATAQSIAKDSPLAVFAAQQSGDEPDEND